MRHIVNCHHCSVEFARRRLRSKTSLQFCGNECFKAFMKGGMPDIDPAPSYETFAEWLSYDASTGVITWKKSKNYRTLAGSPIVPSRTSGHLHFRFCGYQHKVHRVAWLLSYGKWPDGDIDHINGIRDDNRLSNLRDVSRKVNCQNTRSPHGSNQYLGVTKSKASSKFRAQIQIDGKRCWLGSFSTAEEARDAYLEAKRKYHEGCTI